MELMRCIVLLVCALSLVEGHRYSTKRRLIRQQIKEKSLTHKKTDLHENEKYRCPEVNCRQIIPEDCQMKTYFIKNGVKCRGCDNNKCSKKLMDFLTRKIVSKPEKSIIRLPPKLIRIDKPSVRGSLEKPSVLGSLGKPSVLRSPLDKSLKLKHPKLENPQLSAHPEILVPVDSVGPLDILQKRLPIKPLPFPGNEDLVISKPVKENKNLMQKNLLPGNKGLIHEPILVDRIKRIILPDNKDPIQQIHGPKNLDLIQRMPFPDSKNLIQPIHETKHIGPMKHMPLVEKDIIKPIPEPITVDRLKNRPFPGPIGHLKPQPFPGTSTQEQPVPIMQPPVVESLSPVQPIKTPLNLDPVSVLNSPPSDNEFMNRLQFDRNNANLLMPLPDSPIPSTAFNQINQHLPPTQPHLQGQTGFQNQAIIQTQNQQAIAQIRSQQTAIQMQLQQLSNQLSSQPTNGQAQGPPLSNAGMGFNPQGFPMWGQNPNPFLNGMQTQPFPGQFNGFPPGLNGGNQLPTTGILNQIAPVPGFNNGMQNLPQATPLTGPNMNFQGLPSFNGNAGSGMNAQGNFQGQPAMTGNTWFGTGQMLNFPGQGEFNGNMQGVNGLANPTQGNIFGVNGVANPSQGNMFGAGFNDLANPTQGNIQNPGDFSLVDPVTNQALAGSGNSFHGPINANGN